MEPMEPMTPAEIKENLRGYKYRTFAYCLVEALVLLLFLNIVNRGGWFVFLSALLLIIFVVFFLVLCFHLAVLLFQRSVTFTKSPSNKNLEGISWGKPLSPDQRARVEREFRRRRDPVKDDRDDDTL
jgi:hypothetical protein